METTHSINACYSMFKTAHLIASFSLCIIMSNSCINPKRSQSASDEPYSPKAETKTNATIEFAQPDTTSIIQESFGNDTIALPASEQNSLSMVSKIWDSLGALQRQSDSLSALMAPADTSLSHQEEDLSSSFEQESDLQRQNRHKQTVRRAMSHLGSSSSPGSTTHPEELLSVTEEKDETPDLLHEYTEKTRVMCMFSRKARVKGHETVSLVLLEPVTIDGRTYDDGSTITATTTIEGGRVLIRSIEPSHFEAYDISMQKGLGFSEDNKGGQILSDIGSGIIETVTGGITLIPGVRIPEIKKKDSVSIPQGYIFYMVYRPYDGL